MGAVKAEPPLDPGARTADAPARIFGLRGAPQLAPENTLSGLERALELGLDGIAYDVRACASGDLVLMADAYVDRTTDLCGPLAEQSPLELSRADAGVHLGARFGGERVPYLSEALSCGAAPAGEARRPQHIIFAPEPQTLGALAAELAEHGARLSVRVASDDLETCREARDAGLSTLWIAALPDERARTVVAHERFAAIGASPGAWRAGVGGPWPCERLVLRCDAAADLLDACRAPFNALVTSEPERALAIRRLLLLAPKLERFPLQVDELAIGEATRLESEGEWSGRWRPAARFTNPLDAPLRVQFEFLVQRGAFECGELPGPLELAPGASTEFEFELAGGSWSPGGDPRLVARLEWRGEALALDAPLARVRRTTLSATVLRLPLLRESPGDPPASVTVQRHRNDLLAAIEAPGDLEGPRLVVRLGERVEFGARGVRLRLPEGFDRMSDGVPFAVGILGARRTARGMRRFLRRWSGGLPDVAPSGSPGRLQPGARA